ncbi:MAG: hypothetical protein AB8H80_23805 [Planctomycetota bacterium]
MNTIQGKVTALLLASLTCGITAQCDPEWRHFDVGFGVVGKVHAVATWDPDGSGPQSSVAVIGGSFVQAGQVATANIAQWDPLSQSFTAFGTGANGPIRAIAANASGDLFVAGEFTSIGGVQARSIAQWNGTSWQPLDTGIDGRVVALTIDSNGALIAGGAFTSASGLTVNNVASWNGTSWVAMDQGLFGAGAATEVRTFATLSSGELVAGGRFVQTGSSSVRNMARWNGTNWIDQTTGLFAWQETYQVRTLSNGDLIATGNGIFTSAVRLSNGQWSNLVGGTAFRPGLLHVTTTDRIFSADTSSSATPAVLFEAINGAWQQVATTPGFPQLSSRLSAISQLPGGSPDDLILAGDFGGVGLGQFRGGSTTTGQAWCDGDIRCVAFDDDGTLYVGGSFQVMGGVLSPGVAIWDGATWQATGSGLAGLVTDLSVTSNGSVYAVGSFGIVGGASAVDIALWNGNAWQAVPNGPSQPSDAVAMDDGSLLVAGSTLESYDGATWQPVTGVGSLWQIIKLANGNVALLGPAGSFPNGWGRVAIWDGSTLTTPPSIFSLPRGASLAPQGDLLVAGTNNLGELARWDNAAWQPVSGSYGAPAVLLEMPAGDVLAASAIGLEPLLLRWDGQSWATIADAPPDAVGPMAKSPDGSIATVWGRNPTKLSIWRSGCPAAAINRAPGCTGSGGANRLTATRWPSIGGDYVALASELPTTCLVADILGLVATSVPLNSLLPASEPGCTISVEPQFVRVGVGQTGSYRSSLAIPVSTSLVGQSILHQLAPIEVDTSGNIVAASVTNSFELTIGSFE